MKKLILVVMLVVSMISFAGCTIDLGTPADHSDGAGLGKQNSVDVSDNGSGNQDKARL